MSHRARKALLYSSLYLFTIAILVSSVSLSGKETDDFGTLRTVIIFFATVLLTKYFLYMTLSPLYDVAVAWNNCRFPNHYRPLVSVIIPAWNEEVGILTTVQSLIDNTYKNLEIVIVNDGSTDNSDAVIRRFIRRYRRKTPREERVKIVYHYKENGGKGRALNAGIGLSSGDIIVSIDADCYVEKGAIAHFVNCFRDPAVSAAVGNVKIGNTQTILGTIQALEFLFSFYFKKADSLLNTIYIIGGAAGAFRREVFEKLGPYNVHNITEDIELSVRIQKSGLRIVYAADAVIYTEGAADVRGLLRQRLRWKRGRFETFNEHRGLFFSTDKKHNKILAWIILPLALFAEVQLFLEIFFLGFLYYYSAVTQNFSSFISGLVVVSSMFMVQILFDNKESRRLSFVLLAPIGWLLFYLTTVVEYYSLMKSVLGFLRGEECKWQKWQRRGVGL